MFPAPVTRELPPARPLENACIGTQCIFLETGRADAAIYARDRVGVGTRVAGPAILSQLDATTLILAGQVGVVDELGNLMVGEAV